MIPQFAFVLICTLWVAIASLVIKTLIEIRLSYNRFKKDCRGLPIIDGWSWLDGHLKSFMFKPDLNRILHKYHEKYGKSYGVLYGAQRMVVTIDLDFVKLYGIEQQAQHINRVHLGIPMKEIEEDCILTAEEEQWRRIRRALAPTFNKSKFSTPTVAEEINVSIEKLLGAIEQQFKDNSQKGSVTFNADDYIHRFAADVILSCFYKQPDVIDFYAKEDKMIQMLDGGLADTFTNPAIRWTIVWPMLRPIMDRLVAYFDPLGAWSSQMINYVKIQAESKKRARKEMQERQKGDQKTAMEDIIRLRDGTIYKPNMIDHFIDQFHEGKVTEREYLHSTWFLFSAADKPASDVLIYALYQLSISSTGIQDKLAQDVLINGERSEYLTWVINEALRLMPPAPIGCSRTLKNDIKVEGGVVPKGTFVITPTYVIHRLKEYWGEDANEFKPERFANQRAFHPCQYMPFGAGSRGCPGKEFAMHEMRLVLAKLIARYKFACKPKASEGFDAPYLMYIVPYEPTILEVSRRY